MNTRRCNSEACQVVAARRSASFDMPLATVLIDPKKEWNRIAFGNVRVARDIEVNWKKFTQDDYLFSHVSIVCSVSVGPNGFYIDPCCSELVNHNGNAWSNEVLLATFRTFIGAENYLEHVQIPALSKGKIIDAVIRPIHHVDKNGEADIWWCDILVATARKHQDLVRQITSGELTTMSMGCFLSGSAMTMADGTFKNIEDVIVGERVKTHTGGIGTVESTRIRLANDGELKRLSITGVPDTMVTREHPYWALRGYDVCAGCGEKMTPGKPWSLKQIMKGWCSSSCYQTHHNSMWSAEKTTTATLVEQKVKFDWVPVSGLRIGDYVAVPLGRPKMKRSSLDPSLCRILGYYAAEGSFQKSSGGMPTSTEFSFGLAEESVVDLLNMVSQRGIAKDKVYVQDRIRKSGKSTRVVVHDKELALWLYENAGQYSHLKCFAPWITELDDESLLHILGAMENGDGHCRKDSARFRYSSTSRKLAEQVWSMSMSIGIPVSFGGPYQQKGRKPSWSVTTRKGEAGVLSGYSHKFIPQTKSHHDVQNFAGHMLRRVKKVEDVPGSYFVHNIHVSNPSGDHSYIINGIAVHNCEANWVQCSKCGREFKDDDKNCEHLDNEMLQYFADKDGVRHIIAELCGRTILQNGKRVGDPASVKFIEASWVQRPAFVGAVLNHYVSDISKVSKILHFNNAKLAETVEELFRIRVADTAGMMALRVAKFELMRRQREEMVSRVARSFYAAK